MKSSALKLILAGLVTVFSIPGYGVDDDLTPPAGTTTIAEKADGEATTASTILYLGTGIALHNSEAARKYGGSIFGYGLTAGFLNQFGQSGLYWGGDFATHFWGLDSDSALVNGWRTAVGVQVLPTLVYRFAKLPEQSLQPFFGVSLGPNFFVVRQGSLNGPSSSEISVYFELLARPGIDWQFTKAITLNAEAKVGILNWDFIFLPSVNLTVNL